MHDGKLVSALTIPTQKMSIRPASHLVGLTLQYPLTPKGLNEIARGSIIDRCKPNNGALKNKNEKEIMYPKTKLNSWVCG